MVVLRIQVVQYVTPCRWAKMCITTIFRKVGNHSPKQHGVTSQNIRTTKFIQVFSVPQDPQITTLTTTITNTRSKALTSAESTWMT
jgi:hypothetical protein